MKKTVLLITSLVFITSLSFSQSKMDINNLIDRGGLLYEPNDDQPYTGKVFDFHESGQKKLDGKYRNGLRNGKWTYWAENGKKVKEETYKDGKEDGLWTWWYENGQKKEEVTFKDGEMISGKKWNKDGSVME